MWVACEDFNADGAMDVSIVNGQTPFISILMNNIPPASPPTPAPTIVPTSIPTPTVAPTEIPGSITISLEMPALMYQPGDECYLNALISNSTDSALHSAKLLVFLDVGIGEYWFWPSWVHYPPSLDYLETDIAIGSETHVILPPFAWPENAGSAQNLIFWGAITDEAISEIIGDIASASFSYSE